MLPVLISDCVCRRPSWKPKTWLSFWFSTRFARKNLVSLAGFTQGCETGQYSYFLSRKNTIFCQYFSIFLKYFPNIRSIFCQYFLSILQYFSIFYRYSSIFSSFLFNILQYFVYIISVNIEFCSVAELSDSLSKVNIKRNL